MFWAAPRPNSAPGTLGLAVLLMYPLLVIPLAVFVFASVAWFRARQRTP